MFELNPTQDPTGTKNVTLQAPDVAILSRKFLHRFRSAQPDQCTHDVSRVSRDHDVHLPPAVLTNQIQIEPRIRGDDIGSRKPRPAR